MQDDSEPKTLSMERPREHRKEEPRGTLMVLDGVDAGAVYLLGVVTLIGRGTDVHVRIDDAAASRTHAHVLYKNGAYEVEDLGSANGTYVGDERLRGQARLQSGTLIQIGNTLLRFAL